MTNDELRIEFSKRVESEHLSLRGLESRTGISFSTLSRFKRGGVLTSQNAEKLEGWLSGKSGVKSRVISSKRMRVGSKTFIVTIEELTQKREGENE